MIGAFDTITKGLLKGLEDLEVGERVESIKRQHYWKRLEYWEESWRLKETCYHSNSSEKPSANTDVKNSKRVNNKLGRMKVTVISIVVGALSTVTKGLVKGQEDLQVRGRVETIQTTGLGSAIMLRRGLGRLVTQTPVKDHWVTLMWEIVK